MHGLKQQVNVFFVFTIPYDHRCVINFSTFTGIANSVATHIANHYMYKCLCDLQLSEIDLQDSLKAIGLSEELQQDLLQQYVDNRVFIRSIQKELSMDLPHYTNLEWRLDVKVTGKMCWKKYYASLISQISVILNVNACAL